MSGNQSVSPSDVEPSWDGQGLSHPRAKHELWTLTFAFFAHDEGHAHTVAQHASRRLARMLPWFNKDSVAMTRETDPYQVISVYCDDDIYCVLKPLHTGPCRAQDGADLDRLDLARDGAPIFGGEL